MTLVIGRLFQLKQRLFVANHLAVNKARGWWCKWCKLHQIGRPIHGLIGDRFQRVEKKEKKRKSELTFGFSSRAMPFQVTQSTRRRYVEAREEFERETARRRGRRSSSTRTAVVERLLKLGHCFKRRLTTHLTTHLTTNVRPVRE